MEDVRYEVRREDGLVAVHVRLEKRRLGQLVKPVHGHTSTASADLFSFSPSSHTTIFLYIGDSPSGHSTSGTSRDSLIVVSMVVLSRTLGWIWCIVTCWRLRASKFLEAVSPLLKKLRVGRLGMPSSADALESSSSQLLNTPAIFAFFSASVDL
jgi:hypothetical protein